MTTRSLEFIIPGDLQTRTGGYGYDRRIITGLRALGWQITLHGLEDSFPTPTAAALEHAQTVLGRLSDQSLVLIDGLAAGAMPQVLEPHASRLRLIALVHHPLAAENGLDSRLAAELAHSERLTLQLVRSVIVTSRATLDALRPYGVDAGRIVVVEPGTDPAPLTRHARGHALHLLCVATLIPRKGHDLLFDALAALASPNWHLTCVGSITRDPETVERLRTQIRRLGLDLQVTLTGDLNAAAIGELYKGADAFVLPTRLEGYGMVIAEALAHGLPIISTHTGGITELVGTRAGILVAPGDPTGLREALGRVLHEPTLLSSLAAGAATVRNTLPTWEHACARMAQALKCAPPLENAPDGGR